MINTSIRIESLKTIHDVTKLDMSFNFRIDIKLNIQSYITCIVYDLSALGVA